METFQVLSALFNTRNIEAQFLVGGVDITMVGWLQII